MRYYQLTENQVNIDRLIGKYGIPLLTKIAADRSFKPPFTSQVARGGASWEKLRSKIEADVVQPLQKGYSDRIPNELIPFVKYIINLINTSVNPTPLNVNDRIYPEDPRYTVWVIDRYVTGGIRLFEDIIGRTQDALLYHASNINRFQSGVDENGRRWSEKDINHFKTLAVLEMRIREMKDAVRFDFKEKDLLENNEAIILHNDKLMKVVVPLTERASCFYGINTSWCTAATSSNNYFNDYHKKGRLYIIIDKSKNRKYQLHFETGEFMNANDSPINIYNLILEYPILVDVISEMLSMFYRATTDHGILYYDSDVGGTNKDFYIYDRNNRKYMFIWDDVESFNLSNNVVQFMFDDSKLLNTINHIILNGTRYYEFFYKIDDYLLYKRSAHTVWVYDKTGQMKGKFALDPHLPNEINDIVNDLMRTNSTNWNQRLVTGKPRSYKANDIYSVIQPILVDEMEQEFRKWMQQNR